MKKEYIQPKAKEVTVEFHSQMMDNSVSIDINSDESYNGDDSGIGAKGELDFDW